MVSLKDIANMCGVSVATVSKALNDQPDVGQETRDKIKALADELGYFTNSAARALKTNRTNNIGVLFVDEGHRGLTHEFFAALLNSFKAEAEHCGYDITFINNRNVGGKPMSYLQHCLYRGIDGLLIACVDFYDEQVIEVANSSIPLVTISYACSMGHRRIAFIYGEPTAVTQNRKIGFHRACEANGLQISKEYVAESRFYDPDTCYSVTKKILSLPERPTCILFPDDFSLAGGVRAIQEAGLRIPDDISVIGYDGIIVSQLMSPKITTMQQDTDRLGKEAAVKLIELIERPNTTLLDRIIVPGKLLKGDSVKKLV